MTDKLHSEICGGDGGQLLAELPLLAVDLGQSGFVAGAAERPASSRIAGRYLGGD